MSHPTGNVPLQRQTHSCSGRRVNEICPVTRRPQSEAHLLSAAHKLQVGNSQSAAALTSSHLRSNQRTHLMKDVLLVQIRRLSESPAVLLRHSHHGDGGGRCRWEQLLQFCVMTSSVIRPPYTALNDRNPSTPPYLFLKVQDRN